MGLASFAVLCTSGVRALSGGTRAVVQTVGAMAAGGFMTAHRDQKAVLPAPPAHVPAQAQAARSSVQARSGQRKRHRCASCSRRDLLWDSSPETGCGCADACVASAPPAEPTRRQLGRAARRRPARGRQASSRSAKCAGAVCELCVDGPFLRLQGRPFLC